MTRAARASLLMLFVLAMLLAGTVPCRGWQQPEHAEMAELCLRQVIDECGLDLDCRAVVWQGRTFAELSAWSAREDRKSTRFQRRGQTVLEQLRGLSREQLAAALASHLGDTEATASSEASGEVIWPEISPAELPSRNVLGNYLVHHLIALHYGQRAGQLPERHDEAWSHALAYEAMALGYLCDAFSSSHLLMRDRNFFSLLHPFNSRQAHDHFRGVGVYVLDSRGEVWQTFGDGLLFWYRSTREHVQEACLSSLRELLVVYSFAGGVSEPPASLAEWMSDWLAEFAPRADVPSAVRAWLATQDGDHYYTVLQMPTLLRLPMVVAATWSRKLPGSDEFGVHLRRHYPQLREDGCHDPDLHGIDPAFLQARAAVPDWLVLPGLPSEDPGALVRNDREVASVRFIQERQAPPSFTGGLLVLGGGWFGLERTGTAGGTFGVGFGLIDEMIPFRRLPNLRRISLELSYQPHVGEEGRKILSPAVAFQIHLPRLFSLHIESGYAYGMETPYLQKGPKTAIGFSTQTLPLGFIEIGVALRAKYQVLYLDDIVSGAFLEIVLH